MTLRPISSPMTLLVWLICSLLSGSCKFSVFPPPSPFIMTFLPGTRQSWTESFETIIKVNLFSFTLWTSDVLSQQQKADLDSPPVQNRAKQWLFYHFPQISFHSWSWSFNIVLRVLSFSFQYFQRPFCCLDTPIASYVPCPSLQTLLSVSFSFWDWVIWFRV